MNSNKLWFMEEKELIHFGNILYEDRKIIPGKIGISSRQINYWIKEGLIPFVTWEANQAEEESNKNKWIRLNTVQAVWACLVQEMFNLNVSKEMVLKMSNEIWQKSRTEKYADKVFKRHIEKNPNHLSDDTIQKLKGILSDELLMEYYYRTIINPFTDIIKSAYHNRNKMPYTFFFVPATGYYELRDQENSLLENLCSLYQQHTVVSIPFVPILAKLINVELSDKKIKDLSYLNNIEKQIRDIVVFKKPKVVEIAFDNGDIKPITVTESHKSREKLAQYILENKIQKGSKLLIDIRNNDNYKITLIKKNK